VDQKFFKNKKELIIQITWFVFVVALFVFSFWLLRNGELQLVVENLGFWAPLLVIVLKMSTLIIAPLGGTPIYVLSGAVFGPTSGFIIVMIGDILGSSVCFFISRKYGAKILKTFVGEGNVEKVLQTVNIISSTKTFTKARLGFISMPELLAYAAGLSKIKFTTFTLINSVFYVPIVFLYVFFGSAIVGLSVKYFFIFPIIISVFSISGFLLLYKDYEKVEGM
jgi:uncharacterized membrane protein YdjX (TVP38/TMEM64 family)